MTIFVTNIFMYLKEVWQSFDGNVKFEPMESTIEYGIFEGLKFQPIRSEKTVLFPF